METKRNADNKVISNIELVLEEFNNEQKSQTKSLNELVLAVNSLSNIVVNFKAETHKPNSISDSTDTLSIQEMLRKGIYDIKLIVSMQQPKPFLKKYQLLLFPEQDAKLFYKIVFGRWFLWLIIMLFLTNSYKLAVHMNDNQSELKLQLLKNDRLVQSWNDLYLKSDKTVKILMDNAYFRSGEH